MDSKGERPGEPCDPDCEWVSGRPHWNFKERLVFLDCSDGCLGSCLVILAPIGPRDHAIQVNSVTVTPRSAPNQRGGISTGIGRTRPQHKRTLASENLH